MPRGIVRSDWIIISSLTHFPTVTGMVGTLMESAAVSLETGKDYETSYVKGLELSRLRL